MKLKLKYDVIMFYVRRIIRYLSTFLYKNSFRISIAYFCLVGLKITAHQLNNIIKTKHISMCCNSFNGKHK